MMHFSDGGLCGEACSAYRHEVPYFWYRDVLLQAQDRGLLRITAHEEGNPFWWRRWEDSVEVVSDRLAQALEGETEWKRQAHTPPRA